MNSEERMLHDIGIADFVLTDLMLYLDTTKLSFSLISCMPK